MNRWNIPESLELHILERDRDCVYCRARTESSHNLRLSP
jgi:hypothetical protein